MKKEKEHKIRQNFLTDTIFFGIALATFMGSIVLLVSSSGQYRQVQENIAGLQQTANINKATIEAFKKSNPDNANIALILPSQNTIVSWIQQTEIIASKAGVSQTLTFTNASITKDSIVVSGIPSAAPTIQLSNVLKGSYKGILTYITMLQNNYYYTKIDSIAFSATKASGSTSIISANITLELYVQNITYQTGAQ